MPQARGGPEQSYAPDPSRIDIHFHQIRLPEMLLTPWQELVFGNGISLWRCGFQTVLSSSQSHKSAHHILPVSAVALPPSEVLPKQRLPDQTPDKGIRPGLWYRCRVLQKKQWSFLPETVRSPAMENFSGYFYNKKVPADDLKNYTVHFQWQEFSFLISHCVLKCRHWLLILLPRLQPSARRLLLRLQLYSS